MGSAEFSDPVDPDAIDHLERLADPTSIVVPRPKSGPSVVISVRLPVAVAEQPGRREQPGRGREQREQRREQREPARIMMRHLPG